MRTDILDLNAFYGSPLGRMAREIVSAGVDGPWGAELCRVAGFGFASPYLAAFGAAERVFAMAPGAQGVMHWPEGEANRASLVDEFSWPLPDSSIDRLLIVHGLEESGDPRRLLREAWRVLTNDGRLIVVAAHRRGLWSMIETTPFAAGRPYLKRQLTNLLTETLFHQLEWNPVLFFPPVNARFMLRAARAWERAGARAWPGLSGVLMVEAQKSLMAPLAQVHRARAGVFRPAAIPRPASARALDAERSRTV